MESWHPTLRWVTRLLWVAAVILVACGEGNERGLTPATPTVPAEPLVVGSEGYVPPETTPTAQPIRILFTGDIIPARCVYARHLAYDDFRHAFLDLGPLLRGADITVGSLDASGREEPCRGVE